jgi:membrane protease YdiL (CAAX protease family)
MLSLRKPSASALLAGLCLGAGLVIPMVSGFAPLQARFLPSPEALFEPLTGPMEKLSLGATLFLLAVSPGIHEELVFRGVFLGTMRRVGAARGAVLASAAFFALIHLSVFRFLPTFLLGVVLALLVVRTGSIFPAMLAHAAYNGGAVLLDRLPPLASALDGAKGWVPSVALLALAAGLLARSRPKPAGSPPSPSIPVDQPA